MLAPWNLSYADRMWMDEQVAEERARLERYRKGWQAYFGEHPEPLKVKPDQPNDNVVVNFARLVVDKGVAFLFGQEPVFELDDASTERTPEEVHLDDVWRYNRKMQTLQKLAINGAVCGHAFIKIVLPKPGEPHPRFIILSPEYVSVVTDPDDIDYVWRYVIQYPARDKDGKRLVIRQVVERQDSGAWLIRDEVSRGDQAFKMEREAFWPWLWAPVLDCQNLPSPNEYYGISDIEADMLKLNASANFTLSNLQRIIRFHGHPRTWGKGFTKKELEVSVDGTIILPSTTAELHTLDPASDLSSSIEFYKRIKEAIHETTRIPEVAVGKLESTNGLSGVALQILYQPLVEKVEAKRLTYGEMLIEVNRRLLEMAGYGEENYCKIHWAELLPKNNLEERQVALLDQQLGVSKDTLLTRLGYDAEQEMEKHAVEAEDAADRMLSAFDRDQGPGGSFGRSEETER
jgi:hypothetical protein